MKKRSPARHWLAAGLSLLLLPGGTAAYDRLQLHGDPRHSGNNAAERLLASSNVGRLAFAFQVMLPVVADGAPVYLRAVRPGWTAGPGITTGTAPTSCGGTAHWAWTGSG
jgi:hypothetical protein